MSPIVSPHDVRLVTLIGVAVDLAEELALYKHQNPSENLAASLYLANKRVHEKGEEEYLGKLATDYPLLKEAIT